MEINRKVNKHTNEGKGLGREKKDTNIRIFQFTDKSCHKTRRAPGFLEDIEFHYYDREILDFLFFGGNYFEHGVRNWLCGLKEWKRQFSPQASCINNRFKWILLKTAEQLEKCMPVDFFFFLRNDRWNFHGSTKKAKEDKSFVIRAK